MFPLSFWRQILQLSIFPKWYMKVLFSFAKLVRRKIFKKPSSVNFNKNIISNLFRPSSVFVGSFLTVNINHDTFIAIIVMIVSPLYLGMFTSRYITINLIFKKKNTSHHTWSNCKCKRKINIPLYAGFFFSQCTFLHWFPASDIKYK